MTARQRADEAGRPGTGSAAAADADIIVPQGILPPPGIPRDVFAGAAALYATGQRLDMRALARSLGVSRATLYRRAANREQLLDQVIWWRSRRALVDMLGQTRRLQGVARIAGVVGGILHAVQSDTALHAFLETDPEAALRILTGARSTVQQGLSAALERLIDVEVARGNFASSLDTPTLAYAIVRIGQGFLYSEIIADRTPDADAATTVVTALLHGLNTARSAAVPDRPATSA